MSKQYGGVKLTMRRVQADSTSRRWPDWCYQVVPNHEATLERAEREAAVKIASGEPRVWICRSRHKLAGVVDHRYFTLTEGSVRLLGGYISQEVVRVVEAQSGEENVSCEAKSQRRVKQSDKQSMKKRR